MTENKKKLAIIASKGTLDQAYPPLILATVAASLDWEVGIFFTFYGLNLVNKKKFRKLKVGSVGNPGQPMPVPNIVGMLPGMTGAATKIMKRWMKRQNVATYPELLQTAIDLEVKLYGCQMTMDVFGMKRDDLIPEITDCLGAAGFLNYASDADVTLYV